MPSARPRGRRAAALRAQLRREESRLRRVRYARRVLACAALIVALWVVLALLGGR